MKKAPKTLEKQVKPFLALYMQVVFSKAIETYALRPTQGEAMQIRLEAIFFFLIGKEKSHIKRGTKKATQGIQYLYTQLAQQTTLVRTQPINKTNNS